MANVKAKITGFKRSISCPPVFPVLDAYTVCLLCFGEGHSTLRCSLCSSFTPRVYNKLQISLQVLLLQEDLAIKPPRSNSCKGSVAQVNTPVLAPDNSGTKKKAVQKIPISALGSVSRVLYSCFLSHWIQLEMLRDLFGASLRDKSRRQEKISSPLTFGSEKDCARQESSC